MKPFFITGTDTDSGKTYATCELLKYLKSKNINIDAIKPVASGCFKNGSQLLSEDALNIQKFSNLSLEDINPWRFVLPVSPHIAAEAEGRSLSASRISEYCLSTRFESLDYLLIEGAGGLYVPLNEDETWVDLLKISNIPVILVVAIKLGCINHAFMTHELLKYNKIHCAGWIANFMHPETYTVDQIMRTLERGLDCPKLAEIPYSGALSNTHLDKVFFHPEMA